MRILGTTVLAFLISTTQAQSFEELTTSALKAQTEKHFDEALDLYHSVLQLDKGNFHIYNRIARIYYELGQLDSSLHYGSLTLHLIPDDTTALDQRGHCYLDRDQFHEALADFTALFEATHHKDPDASFNIGIAHKGLGDFSRAIEFFDLTLTLEPHDKYSFYELGYCYAALPTPDRDVALKYYTRAIKEDERYYDPYLNRGLLYAVQFNDLERAHRDLEQSIAIRPKNHLSYLYNGMLYRDEEEFAKAKDMYNQVIEILPDYAEAYFERGVVWYNIGVVNMACKDLSKAESLGHSGAKVLKKRMCD